MLLTHDGYLCHLHEQYIELVTESGYPLWVSELYNQGPGPIKPISDVSETQYQTDQDEPTEEPDLPF